MDRASSLVRAVRAIFLDDAQKLYAKRLNFAFLILALVVLASILFSLTLHIGKELGYRQAKAEQAAPKLAQEPVKPVDIFAGNCLEVARACYQRKRSERVRAGL